MCAVAIAKVAHMKYERENEKKAHPERFARAERDEDY